MNEEFVESASRLKQAFITSLLQREDKLDEPYISSPNGKEKCSWSRRELAEEIQNNSEHGLSLLIMMMNMSADLISRDKGLK